MAKDKDRQLIKSGIEHRADQEMIRIAREKRALARRADDIEATVTSALKRGNKELALKAAKLGAASQDTGLMDRLVKAARKAKTGLKAVPVLGSIIGLGTALQSGNVSAALPAPFEASDLGPREGSVAWKIENGIAPSPEELAKYKREMKSMRDRQLEEIKKKEK